MKLLTTVYIVEDPAIGTLEEIPPMTTSELLIYEYEEVADDFKLF